MLTYTQAFPVWTQWKSLISKPCSAFQLQVYYSHRSYVLKNSRKLQFPHYRKFQQMQAFANRFPYMLHWCKCVYDCRSQCWQTHSTENATNFIWLYITLGQLVAFSILFWKWDLSTSPQHNIPLTAVAPFTLPVQNQRAHRVCTDHWCCSFQLPTSFPVFQNSKIRWFVLVQCHFHLLTGCTYPCTSPPLVQCMFYSH